MSRRILHPGDAIRWTGHPNQENGPDTTLREVRKGDQGIFIDYEPLSDGQTGAIMTFTATGPSAAR
jgi:hypothetical protein